MVEPAGLGKFKTLRKVVLGLVIVVTVAVFYKSQVYIGTDVAVYIQRIVGAFGAVGDNYEAHHGTVHSFRAAEVSVAARKQ